MSKLKELKESYPLTIAELLRRGWALNLDPIKEVVIANKDQLPVKYIGYAELDRMEESISAKLNNAKVEEINLEFKDELL